LKKVLIALILLVLVTVSVAAGTDDYYRVRTGDTLWLLSQSLNLTVEELIEWNELDPEEHLYVGQRLRVKPPQITEEESEYYKVRRGDTLFRIARRFGVSTENLREWNDLQRWQWLRVGEKLRVAPPREEGSIYVVQPGDTLWLISQRLGVTIEDLAEWNDLTSLEELEVGQRLFIKTPQTDPVEEEPDLRWEVYQVETGDTLWGIARKFDVSLQDLIELNNIRDYRDLYSGRWLLIPREIEEEKEELPPPMNEPEKPFYTLHEVKRGETLWQIARHYGVSTEEIYQSNGQNVLEELNPGDIILVPLPSYGEMASRYGDTQRRYRVQGGETVEELAERYNIPEHLLRRLNGLTDNQEIRQGQVLIMPINPAILEEHRVYRTQRNEYIFDIAYRFDRALRPLLDANYMTDNNARIPEGTVLIIPMGPNTEGNWVSYENGEPPGGLIDVR